MGTVEWKLPEQLSTENYNQILICNGNARFYRLLYKPWRRRSGTAFQKCAENTFCFSALGIIDIFCAPSWHSAFVYCKCNWACLCPGMPASAFQWCMIANYLVSVLPLVLWCASSFLSGGPTHQKEGGHHCRKQQERKQHRCLFNAFKCFI